MRGKMTDRAVATPPFTPSLPHMLLPAWRMGRARVRSGRRPTIGDLLESLGPRVNALGAALLALPFLWPFGLGPFSVPAGFVMFYLGWREWQRRADAPIPDKWLLFQLPSPVFRGMRWGAGIMAKWRHRRLTLGQAADWIPEAHVQRAAAVGIMAGAFLLGLPAFAVPFSNGPPAIAIICFSCALLHSNRTLVLAGAVWVLVSVLFIAGLGIAVLMAGSAALDATGVT